MRCQNGENKTNQQDRNSNTRNEGNNREPTKFDKKYGIKTRKSPPNIPALDNFELDMLNMVKGLKKKKKQKYMNPRLQKINETFKKIKDDDMLKVPADKTMNIYSIDYNKYNELILTELRKKYRIAEKSELDSINTSIKEICEEIGISNKIEVFTPLTPRFTFKDHKETFNINPSIRLISPCISDIGNISKKILDSIIPNIKQKITNHLWISSDEVIDWFKNISIRSNSMLISFDIDAYYPSITPQLFKDAISFAKTLTSITKIETDIVNLARRSIIKYDNKLWTRNNRDLNFDITMGSADSSQATDVVGLYILQKLSEEIPELKGGLYRDDALFYINGSIRIVKNTKTKIKKIFNDLGLTITFNENYKTVNFLDLTLDIINKTYEPYHKPNQALYYIDNRSNHPPSMKAAIIPNISKRLSKISINEDKFNKNREYYNEAIKKSGYNKKIQYIKNHNVEHTNFRTNVNIISYNRVMNRNRNKIGTNNRTDNNISTSTREKTIRMENNTNTNRKNRRKQQTWFNIPYSIHIKNNIPKEFYEIIDNNFPPSNKLSKIINKNTVKISYSTSPNLIRNIIGTNRAKIEKANNNNLENNRNENRGCNCRVAIECPLEGNCLVSDVVYKCEVKTNRGIKAYIGSTSTQFKTRLNNHISSFNKNNNSSKNIINNTANTNNTNNNHSGRETNRKKNNNDTALGEWIRELKSKNIEYTLKWSVIGRAKSYHPSKSGKCSLCLLESYKILTSDKSSLLNHRTDNIQICLHKNKFLISRYR